MDHRDQIDEFESMFRRAEREPFLFADLSIDSIALVTDTTATHTETLRRQVLEYLPRLATAKTWKYIGQTEHQTVEQLLTQFDREPVDLIITYRLLREGDVIPPYSLGVYLDVLTQATSIPVLVLPGTSSEPISLVGRVADRVMVVTNQIAGDARLVNSGVRMCGERGTVWLCHVEDEAVFRRYLRAIARIPEIETEQACQLIERQLLKEATDFIETCVLELRDKSPQFSFESIITRGHYLKQYRSLIDAHDVDLLVTNTKDENQLAMHGMAYSLCVEFRDVAMLLL